MDARADWASVKSGFQVLRLWQAQKAGTIPELAILKLTAAQLEQFKADPVKFVNAQEPLIFSKPLIRDLGGCEVKAFKPGSQAKTTGYFLVFGQHDEISCIAWSVMPELAKTTG
jgi:hypothetical protein